MTLDRKIYCFRKDKERLKKHLKRLIILVKDYQENKEKYKMYIYDNDYNDYVDNDNYTYLVSELERLNCLLELCDYQLIDNIYDKKEKKEFIDYLVYLKDRD